MDLGNIASFSIVLSSSTEGRYFIILSTTLLSFLADPNIISLLLLNNGSIIKVDIKIFLKLNKLKLVKKKICSDSFFESNDFSVQ